MCRGLREGRTRTTNKCVAIKNSVRRGSQSDSTIAGVLVRCSIEGSGGASLGTCWTEFVGTSWTKFMGRTGVLLLDVACLEIRRACLADILFRPRFRDSAPADDFYLIGLGPCYAYDSIKLADDNRFGSFRGDIHCHASHDLGNE